MFKRNLVKNQKGQGLIEYLIIVALMSVAAIAIVRVMGQSVNSRFAEISYALRGHKVLSKTTLLRALTTRKKILAISLMASEAAMAAKAKTLVQLSPTKMDFKNSERGSALVEHCAVLSVLIPAFVGLMILLYLGFAKVWLSHSSDEAAICLSTDEDASTCENELRFKVQNI